jgi:hypothetical protein
MCRSEWDFEGEPEEAKDDPAWQRLFGEEDSDQFGIRTALFVLALACFFAAVFFMARPNSETSQGAINGPNLPVGDIIGRRHQM